MKCHITCRSEECFEKHLVKRKRKNKDDASKCDLYWRCLECWKVLKTEERTRQEHRCEEWLCKCCKQYVDPDHLCYVRALEEKKSNSKFIFFDIETTQNEIVACKDGYISLRKDHCQCSPLNPCKSCSLCTNCGDTLCGKHQHKANLIIAQKVCPSCIDKELSPDSKCNDCGSRCQKCKKYLKDEKCYEFPPCEKTCGFREMVFKGEHAVTEFGQWLFEKTHKDFTVLAHNMRSFDASVCSTVFRTKFLTENWEVKLKNEDGEITEWTSAYKQNGELHVKLENDWVNQSELQQQNYTIEESKFVDSPISQVPANGYCRDQYSLKSIKWLEFLMEHSRMRGNEIFIQHALNEGEVSLTGTRYKFGGYCASTNTVYEFLGCLYHGCKDCYPLNRHQMKMPRTKQSLEELNASTLRLFFEEVLVPSFSALRSIYGIRASVRKLFGSLMSSIVLSGSGSPLPGSVSLD
ncbi:hypothetical protein KUTeg_001320 [Tegillarca granosa]|uniref:DNA-directed DNA polymerase n=1 Tax=Tegillarca granosa TaxID=220873 RepID=A0ABQ9FV68_TEGGR|nr:hypothetical protein KUTeg_001320 [Tegillarca granosa]